MIKEEIKSYVETNILPEYAGFDKAHNTTHVNNVIENSMHIANDYKQLNIDMIYVIAAFHDLGIKNGREQHEIYSGQYVSGDKSLPLWFTEAEIITIKEAVEDHRASNINEPRSIYGKIIADADRDIDIQTILTRTFQYGTHTFPEVTLEEQIERAYTHIKNKYGEDGYMKLWLHNPFNDDRLDALRNLISDKNQFRVCFIKVNHLPLSV